MLALAALPTVPNPPLFIPAAANVTIPDPVAPIQVVFLTGSASDTSVTTTAVVLPANPIDQMTLLIVFNGAQLPSWAPNTGQSFPEGIPPSLLMNAGTQLWLYYDASGISGVTDAWYVRSLLSVDGGVYSPSGLYPLISAFAAIQAVQQDIATLNQTANQINVTVTSAEPYTIQFSLSSTLVAPGTVTSNGFQDGTDALAGNVGEYQEVIVASPGTSLTTLTATDIAGLTLAVGPGDWDAQGNVVFSGTATTIGYLVAGLSPSANTIPAAQYQTQIGLSRTSALNPIGQSLVVQSRRFSSAGSGQTIHLPVEASFSGGTLNAWGYIRARRVR